MQQQLSETTLCNGGECSAGRDQTQGTSIDFSLGTDSNAKPGTLSQSAIAKNPVLNLLSFFDGGFSVVESTDIGYTNDCTADAGKKAVCIWSRVAHTAVSVGKMPSLDANGSSTVRIPPTWRDATIIPRTLKSSNLPTLITWEMPTNVVTTTIASHRELSSGTLMDVPVALKSTAASRDDSTPPAHAVSPSQLRPRSRSSKFRKC